MLLLPIPWIASAAGLGGLAVLSSLGQPFRAEIDLVSQKDELATLSSRIASPDAYKQANFQYSPALAGLRLNVKQRPDGRAYIEITSSRPVDEPFVDLLIELNWDSARIIRGYTALIDPPGFGPIPVTSARATVPAQPASGAQSAVSSKITAHVEDKTTLHKAKDVAWSFKAGSPNDGAANRGKTHSMSYRIHILEDKSILFKKALTELVERIALMEQSVQDIQRLLEIRIQGMAAAQKRAEVKPLAQSPEATPLIVAATTKPEAASVDIKKEKPQTASPTENTTAQAKSEKQKLKIVLPPSPESGLVNTILGARLYLAAGGIVILLGGLAFWIWRRRRSQVVTSEDILNKLLARDPGRADVQIKLIEIYAARQDKVAFDSAAGKLNKLTGGQGEDWLKIAAMGYALDPGNPLYVAGKDTVTAAAATNKVI